MAKEKRLKITLVKSIAGGTERQIANVRGLGLRRMHHTVSVQDTPCNRGMINKVSHLLKVEEELV